LGLVHQAAGACLPDKRRKRPFTAALAGIVAQGREWRKELARFGLLLEKYAVGSLVRADDGSWTLAVRDEQAARYLAGGYAEEFVMLTTLRVLRHAGIDGRHMLARALLPFVESDLQYAGAPATRNELDVAIVWRNRLLVIECKAGLDLAQEGGQQKVLDKLLQVKERVGGVFGEAWALVTRTQADAGALPVRAAEYGIRLVEGPQACADLHRALASWLKVALPASIDGLPLAVARWQQPAAAPRTGGEPGRDPRGAGVRS
jgi:hypothetical protein